MVCNSYSNYTILPNYYGHNTLQDAELSSYVFIPLLQSNCSMTPLLTQLVCSLHFPSTSACNSSGTTDVSLTLTLPCREICEMISEECAEDIEKLDFQWPREAACSKLPSVVEGNCDTFGESSK